MKNKPKDVLRDWACGSVVECLSRLGLVSKSQEFTNAEIIKTYYLCYLLFIVVGVWCVYVKVYGAQGTALWSGFSYLSVGWGVKLRLPGL